MNKLKAVLLFSVGSLLTAALQAQMLRPTSRFSASPWWSAPPTR